MKQCKTFQIQIAISRLKIFHRQFMVTLQIINGYIDAYALPLLMISGLIENIFILIIFNTKEGKKGTSESLRIYYIFIAIGDLIRILSNQFILWLGNGLNFATVEKVELYVDEISNFTCVLRSFIYLFSVTFSNWLVIGLCLERIWALYFPLSIRGSAGKRRAINFTLFIGLLSIITTIPSIFM